MPRGIFVTGTDTNVGKTVAAASLLHRYRDRASLRYWKPIQTGVETDDDTAEVQRLGPSGASVLTEGIRLTRPVSPHLAARLSGSRIELRALEHVLASQPESARWIIEGAGGVLVPVNDHELMVDLMVLLQLPVLIVARSSLGTINHTLLSIEALRARSLTVAGVLMIGNANAENRAAIEGYGSVPVVGEMPQFDPLSLESLAQWASAKLDPEERLAKWLT